MKEKQTENKKQWLYTANFCEENIYHLAQSLNEKSNRVFILSNLSQSVALAHQRAGQQGMIIWDYHVILLQKTERGHQIWDLDSCLGLPVDATYYFEKTFFSFNAHQHHKSLIKDIPADTYLSEFQSDRRHMKNGGDWLSPPPAWPLIGTSHTLDLFLDMTDDCLGAITTPETIYRSLS